MGKRWLGKYQGSSWGSVVVIWLASKKVAKMDNLSVLYLWCIDLGIWGVA
jgi:hypothetical protein